MGKTTKPKLDRTGADKIVSDVLTVTTETTLKLTFDMDKRYFFSGNKLNAIKAEVYGRNSNVDQWKKVGWMCNWTMPENPDNPSEAVHFTLHNLTFKEYKTEVFQARGDIEGHPKQDWKTVDLGITLEAK